MCGRQVYHGIDRETRALRWLDDIVVGDGEANEDDDGDDDDVRDSGGVTE